MERQREAGTVAGTKRRAVGTAVLEETRRFAALQEEWDELYGDSPRATPSQSWAWLYSWWEAYGRSYELRLVTVRSDEGLLLGLLPLMLERGRMGLGRLLFVGSGITDHLDVIVREGWEEEVSRAGVRAIEDIGSWRVADLWQIRPEAAAWDLYRDWSGYRGRLWQDGCPTIDVGPPDEMLASLSRNHRSTVRRALRRAEADGVYREQASAEEAGLAARRLVALHRESWRGRDIDPEHLTRRFEAHIENAARRMAARGIAGISEFRRDGEVIVSDLWLRGSDFIGTYMLGVSQEALKRYQWSSLYIWDAAEIARGAGIPRVSLLRGEEPYKLRWRPEVVPNHRLILAKDPLLLAPYATYHRLRSGVRRYARSESAPWWVRRAADAYRTLRLGGRRR